MVQSTRFKTTEAYLVAKSFYLAAYAYLQYKQLNYEEAVESIHRALDIDATLEDSYGLGIIGLHRVQLAHNLVRVAASQHGPEVAIADASSLLSFLEGNIQDWPVRDEPPRELSAEISSTLVEAMFVQVTGEVALLLAPLRDDEVARLTLDGPLASHAAPQAGSSCRAFKRAHDWINLESSLSGGKATEFLRDAIRFIEDGRGGAPLLWYAAVADLCAICQRVGSQEAAGLAEEIRDDFVGLFESVPPLIRSKVVKHGSER